MADIIEVTSDSTVVLNTATSEIESTVNTITILSQASVQEKAVHS